MIVVIGVPAWQPVADDPVGGRAAGPAVDIARAAAMTGARVELVGRIGEDDIGERLLLDLARAGVGHAALLRVAGLKTHVLPPARADEGSAAVPEAGIDELLAEPIAPGQDAGSNGRASPPVIAPDEVTLEPADLELALRYLVDFRVLVVADDLDRPALRVVVDGAAFAGASLVVVASAGALPDLPDGTTILERPAEDPDADFARLVAGYAAALDRGEEPEVAFRGATAEQGWEAAD